MQHINDYAILSYENEKFQKISTVFCLYKNAHYSVHINYKNAFLIVHSSDFISADQEKNKDLGENLLGV